MTVQSAEIHVHAQEMTRLRNELEEESSRRRGAEARAAAEERMTEAGTGGGGSNGTSDVLEVFDTVVKEFSLKDTAASASGDKARLGQLVATVRDRLRAREASSPPSSLDWLKKELVRAAAEHAVVKGTVRHLSDNVSEGGKKASSLG